MPLLCCTRVCGRNKQLQTKKMTLLYRFSLVAALALIFALAITRISIPLVQNANDKLAHLLAFFALALLADFSWPANPFNAPKILLLFCYGVVIEITQYFLSYRDFSLLDLGADAAGLFLYSTIVPLLRNLSPFKARWKTGAAD